MQTSRDVHRMEQYCPRVRLAQSAELSRGLWSNFQTDGRYPNAVISNSAVSLAHELHASSIQLVGLYNFAAATALLRPLMEAATTASWAAYVANSERAISIIRFERPLPKHSRMVAELKSSTVGDFGFQEMMKGDARIFHDMTHGGIEQLRRRHSATGSTYSLAENYLTLSLADAFLLLAFSIHAAWREDQKFDQLLMVATNSVMQDMFARYLPEKTGSWPGWSRLKTPIETNFGRATVSP